MKYLVVLFVILLSIGISSADDVPSLPHVFYGDVAAPDGTLVEGRADGYVTTADNPVVVYDNKYGEVGLVEQQLLVQGNITNGALITFYVGGVSTGITYPYHPGEVTNLDLNPVVTTVPTTVATTVPTTSPTTTTTTYYSGGGGGGGGGSYYYYEPTNTTTPTPTATPTVNVTTVATTTTPNQTTITTTPTAFVPTTRVTTVPTTTNTTPLEPEEPSNILPQLIISGLIVVAAVIVVWYRSNRPSDPLG